MNSLVPNEIPRITLAHLPTPINKLDQLSKSLDFKSPILIKRDDLTGLGGGGNKIRKLEFLIAEALQSGCDTIVTTGATQSNHCRQTAAVASKFGLKCVLALAGDEPEASTWNGNLLLDKLFGADILWVKPSTRDAQIEGLLSDLHTQGSTPYYIPLGGSNALGSLGYIIAVEELKKQLSERGEQIDRIVVTSSSGSTHAGILVAVKALGLDIIVEGMSNSGNLDVSTKILEIAQNICEKLNIDIEISGEDVVIHKACGTHKYGQVTECEKEAIKLFATTEGIILDPVYTARAAGELINQIRQGKYDSSKGILFWHTGGLPALFAMNSSIL